MMTKSFIQNLSKLKFITSIRNDFAHLRNHTEVGERVPEYQEPLSWPCGRRFCACVNEGSWSQCSPAKKPATRLVSHKHWGVLPWRS